MPVNSDANSDLAQPEQPEQPVQPAMPAIDVILASGSPRRAQLLRAAQITFSVRTSEVDESLEPDLAAQPEEAVKKLAERKAGAIVQQLIDEVSAQAYSGFAAVIGADTMVVKDGVIFGKPHNLSEATGMLRKLSGATHEVMTGVSVWYLGAPTVEDVTCGFRTFVEKTQVTFKPLTDAQIADYLACGESFDKAGAYAIQGEGGKLVLSIQGDFDNVVGLPVGRLLEDFPELRG
ncbi:MAG: Maf family protein [Raoultibacter sp.]